MTRSIGDIMKIIQINAVNGIGSTGRTCLELEQFFSHNSEIRIKTLYASGLTSENSVRISSSVEQYVHGLLSRVTGLQGYYSPVATNRVVKILRKEKPDAIIINNVHSNYINLIKLLNYIAENKIPLLIHLDDCWFYTGKCTHYYSINCNKWKCCCGNCPKLKADIPSWFLDRTRKMFEDKQEAFSKIQKLCIIGVSDWIVNEAKKSYFGRYAKIIKRIYNWIDLETFKPVDTDIARAKNKIDTNQFVILGVASSWSKKKGLDLFLALSDMMQQDEVIILVGNMPDIKLPQNIINIGQTDDVGTLVELYSLADVFVQASIEESFGKVVAESLACGTPVISNRHTANPELIEEGCGIIVNGDDPITYMKAIQEVKKCGKSKYSNNCRCSATQRFNKDILINETIATVIETTQL